MIEEVNSLINDLDISEKHAEEIINIYFECYNDEWIYNDYLIQEIRVLRRIEDKEIIADIKRLDDIALLEGDDYVIITNYQTLIKMEEIEDIIPNHSF